MDILNNALSSFAAAPLDLVLSGAALLIFLIVLVMRASVKRRTVIPTIEHYAPEGMNPPEVSYVADGHVSPGDMSSLLYYWASHRHLSITVQEDGSLRLDRLSELDEIHPEYERRLFADLWLIGGTEDGRGFSLFLTGGSRQPAGRTTTVLTPDMMTDFGLAVNRAYRELRRSFARPERRITSPGRNSAAVRLPVIAAMLAMLVPFFNYLRYVNLFDVIDIIPFGFGAALILTVGFYVIKALIKMLLTRSTRIAPAASSDVFGTFLICFVLAFPFVLYYFENYAIYPIEMDREMMDRNYTFLPSMVSLLFFFVSGLFERAYRLRQTDRGSAPVVLTAAWIIGIVTAVLYAFTLTKISLTLPCTVLISIFTLLSIALSPGIREYTEYGAGLTARCRGFRQFLVTADKDRLEMLIDENPDYYFDVLPYAHALRVSAVWLEKTGDIGPRLPEWFSVDSDSSNTITSVMMNRLDSVAAALRKIRR